MKSEYKGIKRIIKAFSYSFDGFRAVFKSEAAFRQDLLFCLICAIGLCFVTINPVMLAIICFLLFFIFPSHYPVCEKRVEKMDAHRAPDKRLAGYYAPDSCARNYQGNKDDFSDKLNHA